MEIEKLLPEKVSSEETGIWVRRVKDYLENHKSRIERPVYDNFYLTRKSNPDNPITANSILVRGLFAYGDSKDQKYVFLQKYEDFGRKCTMDIVTLPTYVYYHKSHAGIFMEYMDKILGEREKCYLGGYEDFSNRLITGGNTYYDDEIEFEGESSQFGNYISSYSTNAIVSPLVKKSGWFKKSYADAEDDEDEVYFDKVFDLMAKYSGENDFYSKLGSFCFEDIRNGNLQTDCQIKSIVMMKSLDRAAKEKKQLEQILSEEMSDEGLKGELIKTIKSGRK